MSLAIAGTQSIHGDVRVELRSRERSVTEQLLNATKVCATIEEMGGRAVPQAVRSERRSPFHPIQDRMYDPPDLSLVDPPAMMAQKRCCT